MMSQTKKRIQFSSVRLAMRITQVTIERVGRYGEKGTRKPRGRSGWVRRSTSTAPATRTKANSVPMLERSASVPISKIPAGTPTTMPAIHVATCGVLKRGEHDGHANVESGADEKGSHDAERQIALGILAFFRCRGDGIKTDIAEEHDSAAGEHALPAIGHEGAPIRRMNVLRRENDENENGEQLDADHLQKTVNVG